MYCCCFIAALKVITASGLAMVCMKCHMGTKMAPELLPQGHCHYEKTYQHQPGRFALDNSMATEQLLGSQH